MKPMTTKTFKVSKKYEQFSKTQIIDAIKIVSYYLNIIYLYFGFSLNKFI